MIDLNFWQSVGLFFFFSMIAYGANAVLVELRGIRTALQRIQFELANRPPRN